jgi:2-polyprenyl-6-hydroxyphenyl methylase/3-demethylubiquinone-9 3-methyltransferase
MKRVVSEPGWPDSWKLSYSYDLLEVYGSRENLGYSYAFARRRSEALDLLANVLPHGGRVLDVAAAQGNFTLLLAERGYDVTWNDLRAELAAYVALKHETGRIAYAPGNAFELTFPEAFDAVLITEVIEHVAHPDDFLAHVATLVRPGGYVVMTTPNGAYVRNRLPRFSACPDPSMYEAMQFGPNADGHIFLLHPDEIPALARGAGLTIERLETFTTPLTAGHLKTGRALRRIPRSFVETAERACARLPSPLRRRLHIQMSVLFRRPTDVVPASLEPMKAVGV